MSFKSLYVPFKTIWTSQNKAHKYQSYCYPMILIIKYDYTLISSPYRYYPLPDLSGVFHEEAMDQYSSREGFLCWLHLSLLSGYSLGIQELGKYFYSSTWDFIGNYYGWLLSATN